LAIHEDQKLALDAAAGGGRGSTISRGMPANRYRGMAAAVIWNATLRPWRTTFAPIVISFSSES
jgi:hypothetical protein